MGYLRHGITESLLELSPVTVTVALALRFSVHDDCFVSGSRGITSLGVVVDGDFESARGALVLLELEAEHVRVFGLDALCD